MKFIKEIQLHTVARASQTIAEQLFLYLVLGLLQELEGGDPGAAGEVWSCIMGSGFTEAAGKGGMGAPRQYDEQAGDDVCEEQSAW